MRTAPPGTRRRARPRPWHAPRRAVPAAGVLVLLLCALVLVAGTPGAAAGGHWRWPLDPRPEVLRPWVPPAQRWDRGHRGVDLGGAPGAPVRSPADGTVGFVGVVVDRPVLTLDHGGGLRSSFEPVESSLRPGDRVRRGQVVGALRGHDHCAAVACLHWGVRRGEDYLNPLRFVGALAPSVLLPAPPELRTSRRP